MKNVNQKIIDAVIAKAEKLCPDSLALIGVYGSVATKDEYEKSDLDLLILIQDDNGWKLGTGFILENSGIGYDIYCTNWDGLRYDAECHHAKLSKLMDSEIVYVKEQEAYDELCRLRERTEKFLKSEERFERVKELMDKAKVSYANALLNEGLGQVRLDAFDGILNLMDALMLYHGTYFKCGVKRAFEELGRLPIEEDFLNKIKQIAESKEISEIRSLLKSILAYVEIYVRREKQKEEPSDGIAGTYEEMYSNWRNKVEEAAVNGDVFSAFANMCSFNYMCQDISNDVNIGKYSIMEEYNPDNLVDNVRNYDECLARYEEVYKAAGIAVKRFADVDAFVADYLE